MNLNLSLNLYVGAQATLEELSGSEPAPAAAGGGAPGSQAAEDGEGAAEAVARERSRQLESLQAKLSDILTDLQGVRRAGACTLPALEPNPNKP